MARPEVLLRRINARAAGLREVAAHRQHILPGHAEPARRPRFPLGVEAQQGSGVTLDFSRPGKPTDNAFIESLNGKFRAECLNAHWFMSLDDAGTKCKNWRLYYA